MDLPPSTSFNVAPLDRENTTAEELFTLIHNRIALHKDVFVGDFKKKIIEIIDVCLKKSAKTLETIIEDFANTINECLLQFEQQSDSKEDSNDSEAKPFVDCIKTVLDSIEQIDSWSESPSTASSIGSEPCMSEVGSSTNSSGTPINNISNSKRKNVEESQVTKRVYKGRTSGVNKNKSGPPKEENTKTSEKNQTAQREERYNRKLPLILKRILLRLIIYRTMHQSDIPN